MADEKKTPANGQSAEKVSWFTKFLNWCKALPKRIATPFKNMAHELKLVTWPTKRKLIIYSIAVLVFMLFMMIVIGLFDLGSSTLVRALRFGSSSTTAPVVSTVEDAAETAAEAVEETAEAVADTAEQAAETVEETAEAVADTAEQAVEAVEETVEATEQAVETENK